MTKKERVKYALLHQETDIVPFNINFTQPAYRKLTNYFGGEISEDEIGNHIVYIEPVSFNSWVEIKPNMWMDEFGVMWDRSIDKDIGNPIPVLKYPSIKGYKFPDPDNPKRYSHFSTIIEKNKDKFILCSIGFSLFERAWTLRGMENFLIDMIENPPFVNELLDTIVNFNIKIIKNTSKYPIDGFRFGDDWGQQKGLIMGIPFWRKFLKPRLEKMYQEVHKVGLPVFIHSCGDVQEILPELIDIGVNVFNPFQPEVMNIFEIKRIYGDKLSFFGGISVQKLLPFGTPQQVKDETKKILQTIGKGGGYIASPSHDIPKDVPVENIVALIETLNPDFPFK
ncbi:MAG TPA: uroporphyrinogen decarboxylase family protein [bacterium]|nr:uroporphyrinogen decarboxylase family protein [bacterium]